MGVDATVQALRNDLGCRVQINKLVDVTFLCIICNITIGFKSERHLMKTSTTHAIRERIATLPPRQPFTPASFAGMGSQASIKQALSRLARQGVIARIGHGLYAVPQEGPFGLKVLPSPEQIAATLAAKTGATIEIHGAEAAQRFGFSTQVPVQAVFSTSGSSRNVKLGKLKIKLVHVSKRKLALAGRPAGAALLALWYMGKNEVTPETFHKIKQKLPQEEFKALCASKAAMPAWMVASLSKYENQGVSHGCKYENQGVSHG